jgi:cell division protein FtsB
MKRKKNGWKIATIVLAVVLFLSLFVVNGILAVACWGFTLQIAELQNQKAVLTEQIENPETGYKKQIADLNAQLAAAPRPLRVATSQEVIAFLEKDQTDKNTYSFPDYCSPHYARDLGENAQREGLKAGVAFLLLKGGTCCITVFDTSDKGLFFVDPQMDQPVTVFLEKSYWGQNGWAEPGFDGTIVEIVIYW